MPGWPERANVNNKARPENYTYFVFKWQTRNRELWKLYQWQRSLFSRLWW